MRKCAVLFLCCAFVFLILAGCSGDQPKPSGSTLPADSLESGPVLTGKHGPFDEEHFNFGKKALSALDDYIDFKISKDDAFSVLTELYNRKDELSTVPEDDPLYAGNDAIWAYVFLPYIDFENSLDTFPQDIRDHRNLLAEALGLPTRDFPSSSGGPDSSSSDSSPEPTDEALAKYTAFLDSVISSVQSDGSDSMTLSYSVSDDSVFLTFKTDLFDEFLPRLDELSEDDRQLLSDNALSFVTGDVGGPLYDMAVSYGCTQDIYITVSGRYGVVCSACNGKLLVNAFEK